MLVKACFNHVKTRNTGLNIGRETLNILRNKKIW